MTLVSGFQLLFYGRFHESSISFYFIKKLKSQSAHLSGILQVFRLIFSKNSMELFMIYFFCLRNPIKNERKKVNLDQTPPETILFWALFFINWGIFLLCILFLIIFRRNYDFCCVTCHMNESFSQMKCGMQCDIRMRIYWICVSVFALT